MTSSSSSSWDYELSGLQMEREVFDAVRLEEIPLDADFNLEGEMHEDLLMEEQKAEVNYYLHKEMYDADDERTVAAAFPLIDLWITFFRHNDALTLLDEIKTACTNIGGIVQVNMLQRYAFIYFKQFRFQQARDLMMTKNSVMKSAGLVSGWLESYENLGHVYNSLDDTKQAEASFQKALLLLKNKKGGHCGTGLLNHKRERERERETERDRDIYIYTYIPFITPCVITSISISLLIPS